MEGVNFRKILAREVKGFLIHGKQEWRKELSTGLSILRFLSRAALGSAWDPLRNMQNVLLIYPYFCLSLWEAPTGPTPPSTLWAAAGGRNRESPRRCGTRWGCSPRPWPESPKTWNGCGMGLELVMIKGIPALAVKREVFTRWCLLTSLGSQGTGGRGRVVFALGSSCFFPSAASLLSL